MLDDSLNSSLSYKLVIVCVLLEARLGLIQLKCETLILINLIVEVHEHLMQLSLLK